MQFTVYKSTDASAPSLSGTNGSLVALLDACLVNGYGSKAAAGWAKAFSGANKAAYRAPAGVRHYIRVQDDGPGAGVAREARLLGYASMTDVDTGAGAFGSGAVTRKSSTADATARPWYVLADARSFYLLIQAEAALPNWLGTMFGEYFSILSPASTGRSIIWGRYVENSATLTNERLDVRSAITSVSSGSAAVTQFGGGGGATGVGLHFGDANSASATLVGVLTYPNPTDNGLHMGPVWVHEVNNRIGRMRGFWCMHHPVTSFADGTTFTGSGAYAGKTFLIIKPTGNNGCYCFETSDTLETN